MVRVDRGKGWGEAWDRGESHWLNHVETLPPPPNICSILKCYAGDGALNRNWTHLVEVRFISPIKYRPLHIICYGDAV